MVKRVNAIDRYVTAMAYIVVLGSIIFNIVLFSRGSWGKQTDPQEISADSLVLESEEQTIVTFDPNTATYKEMRDAGVPNRIAVNLLRWREGGKIFRIKEDIAVCYGMTDSIYYILEPHIVIGEEFKIEPKRYENSSQKEERREPKYELKVELEPFSLDTVSTLYLTQLGFSTKQSELIIRYRDMIGGYRTFEKFSECYAVDSIMAERLRPYLIFPEIKPIEPKTKLPININMADSATLCTVRGIGPKSAQQIVRYRELLGGYYSVEQISELSVVTTENFEHILPQIYCDSAEIKKININFAASNELKTHPYLTSRMLKLIINTRVLTGGWSTIQEMIDDDIFTSDEAMRIAPYLDFGTYSE